MKKISVAFDGLNFSAGTMQYAIKIATSSNALLTGLILDDFLYHSYPAYEMTESIGLQERDVEKLELRDTDLRKQSIEKFDAACRAAKVNYLIHHDRSFALDELIKESLYSDLLIIGRGESFNRYQGLVPSAFIRQLLAAAHCPVLIVPDIYHEPEKVALLYDGTQASMYAIKMFNYLVPWAKGLPTEVVSVRDPKETLEFTDDLLLKEFINCHFPDAKYVLLTGDPQDEIPAYLAHHCRNCMVTLGAYQRSRASRWLKTSMADILINEMMTPIFIAHPK